LNPGGFISKGRMVTDIETSTHHDDVIKSGMLPRTYTLLFVLPASRSVS
jgi:hypothetical protein